MEVKQIYEYVNNATKEILGTSDLITEDLSNIVDVGTAVFNANAVDNFVKSLVDHIGRVVFVDRVYKSGVPSVLMDSWEYGSIMEKISTDEIPEAEESEDWELEDGVSYDQQIFYKPTAKAKFFNGKKVFTIPRSFTRKQVKSAFSSATQMNAFLSMLENAVKKSTTVKTEKLVMNTISNMIGETVYNETSGGSISSRSGNKAVNLLYLYNQKFSTNLTAADMCTSSGFLQFASYMITCYIDRLKKLSTLFNVNGTPKFTPEEYQHIILHSEFARGADSYLQSGVYHNEMTKLPNGFETVPYWQGNGQSFDFTKTSKIDVTTSNSHSATVTGILGVMFDRDALGVTNLENSVRTAYNAKGDFYNNYYAFESNFFNDFDENFIVFYGA